MLYSVGPNGADDGGTDIGGLIIRGERQASERKNITWEQADIVVLAPLPPFEIVDLKKAEFDEWSEGFETDE